MCDEAAVWCAPNQQTCCHQTAGWAWYPGAGWRRLVNRRNKRRGRNRKNGLLRKLLANGRPARCVLCGATKNLTADHILPLSRGGTNVQENLQVLCWSCNHSKGNSWEEVGA